jgi:hypothetical protein
MAQRIVSQLVRPRPETTVFFLCDVQERFRSLIHKFPSVVAASSILLRGAGVLGCPVLVTEQHPKAFLRTGPWSVARRWGCFGPNPAAGLA